MKQLYAYSFLLFFLHVLIVPSALHAQNLTGIWRGYFITESHDQYKFELQVQQKNNNVISGVSYSYLNTVFYGKATLTGTFNRLSKQALVQEIKTVELRMSVGSNACIMKCTFSYITSGNEEYLEGAFTSIFEKTDTVNNRIKGENCGGGNVYLRKVPTSDFYIEPFLRDYVKNEPAKIQSPQTKTTPPVIPKKTLVISKSSVTSKQSNNTPKIKPEIIQSKADSAVKAEPQVIKRDSPKEIDKIPDVLTSRSNELVKILILDDPDVSIKIFDNGEIDNDTVSVYVDKKLVLSNKRLSASPLILKFKMDESNSDHELAMVAENLGRIPPNTSLMIVEAGDKRYEVRITSTEQKNAVIRFKYKKRQ